MSCVPRKWVTEQVDANAEATVSEEIRPAELQAGEGLGFDKYIPAMIEAGYEVIKNGKVSDKCDVIILKSLNLDLYSRAVEGIRTWGLWIRTS